MPPRLLPCFPALILMLALTAGLRGEEGATPMAASLDLRPLQPLRFEENLGQTDPHVRFLARNGSATLFLADEEIVLALQGRTPRRDDKTRVDGTREAVVRFRPIREGQAVRAAGLDPLPGRSHYVLGNDSDDLTRDVPAFGRVRYEGLRRGIDLVVHGGRAALEYDLEVSPGADPEALEMAIEGAARVRIARNGDLVLGTPVGDVVLRAPVAYQEIDGRRHAVKARHVLRSGGRIGFRIGRYDRSRPLVIDPVLTFSTYLGGIDFEYGNAVATDATGNLYAAGRTRSTDFPVKNALYPYLGGSFYDAFITKFSPDGSLIYSTFLGGTRDDYINGMAVDASGGIFAAGITCSTDFPTKSPVQAAQAGECDAFVTRLSPDGAALVYSTYLGGSTLDVANGIAIDAAGNAYVAGQTSGPFPVVRSVQACAGSGENAFVASLNPAGTSLRYSTCIGGSGSDRASAVAVDGAGGALVCGQTSSSNFLVRNAIQPIFAGGGQDGFVAKLIPDGSDLVFSTYLGGSGYDSAASIAADPQGAIYVSGYTGSTNFPTVRALQPSLKGTSDTFVSVLEPSGTAFRYSTFLGGSSDESSGGIAVDSLGSATIGGSTGSSDFPLLRSLQAGLRGYHDLYVTLLRPDGSGLLYSTLIGGSDGDLLGDLALDPGGGVALTGWTFSRDFPLVQAFQSRPPSGGGSTEAFVARLSPFDLLLTRTRFELEWNQVPGSFGYDVVRGSLSSLLRSGGDYTASVIGCLADDHPRAYLFDPEDPPRGEAYWYLARSVGATSNGTYDSGSPAQVSSSDAEINASPSSCAPPPVPHAIIDISGNGGFTPVNGVVGGTGTPGDPFRIEGWNIDATGSASGISIHESDASFVIRNVRVRGAAGAGITIQNAAHGVLERVRCTSNSHGLFVTSSSDVLIRDSLFAAHPNGRGISAEQSTDITLFGNDLTGNLLGVSLTGTTGAIVHDNNFLNNVMQASDDAGPANAWDAGFGAGGNYWTNFLGQDACSGPAQDVCPAPDGLGDTPYVIDADSLDRYPLMILPGSAVDYLAPLVGVTSPVGAQVISGLTATITGTASDAGSGLRRVEVRFNDGPWTIATGNSSWSATIPIPPGYDILEARAFDHAGNVSATQQVPVIQLDPTANVSVVTDKSLYQPGETVRLAVIVSNLQSFPVNYSFSSSCQSYFAVKDAQSATVYDAKSHAICFLVVTDYTLLPGQSKADLWTWQQVNDAGGQVPFPADYVIRGYIPGYPPSYEAQEPISIGP